MEDAFENDFSSDGAFMFKDEFNLKTQVVWKKESKENLNFKKKHFKSELNLTPIQSTERSRSLSC